MISIVVPVYNTDVKYVIRCVESIREQTYSNYECILVDDGSEENMSSEYRKIIEGDTRFLYFKKENGGVSSARNAGIKQAKGEKICFIDADDTVVSSYLMEANSIMDEKKVDVVIGDFIHVVGDEKFTTGKICFDVHHILSTEEFNMFKRALFGFEKKEFDFSEGHGSCWAKLYRTDIVKDILFNEDVPYSEDWLFNRKYFEKIKSVTVVPEKWYIYYLHNESATHKRPATNYIKNYLPFWDEWYKLDMNVLDAIYLKELYMRNVHSFFAFISIQVLNDTEKFKQKRKIMKEANNHPMFDNNYYKVKLKDVEGIGEKLRFICVRYRMILLSYFLVSVKKKKWRLI